MLPGETIYASIPSLSMRFGKVTAISQKYSPLCIQETFGEKIEFSRSELSDLFVTVDSSNYVDIHRLYSTFSSNAGFDVHFDTYNRYGRLVINTTIHCVLMGVQQELDCDSGLILHLHAVVEPNQKQLKQQELSRLCKTFDKAMQVLEWQ